ATAHVRVLEDFVEAVARHRAPCCDGASGRESVRLIEAIYRSAGEKRPVELIQEEGMRFAAALGFLLTAVSAPAAQEFRGGITRRVNDRSGGVLPGVTVTATNVATNVASATTTNNDGLFTIPYLVPGTYTVAAELSGFKKTVREGLEVRIGDRLVVDMDLDVGQIEETVTVSARSPLLEVGSGSAGQGIGEKTSL